MIQEIKEIPVQAKLCYEKNRKARLPLQVPYIGMGSSYFAPLTLKYLGINIYPEIASEYYNYLYQDKSFAEAVLISQSGYSSETLWNIERFPAYTAISNDPGSPLAKSPKAKKCIELHAGPEKYSATKTYLNTLISLYCGFDIECKPALHSIHTDFSKILDWGQQQAETIMDIRKNNQIKGIYIIGSGPNIATAYEAALILSEATKIPFIPMATGQYDHGPKETAENTIVLPILSSGPSHDRTKSIVQVLRSAGAFPVLLEETGLPEHLTPLKTIIYLNSLAWYLSQKLGIQHTFSVGDKITTVKK